MRVLVTGGAGYIGAHVVAVLTAVGHEVVIADDLSTGVADRVSAPIARIDLAAAEASAALTGLMSEHGTEAVIHLAARKQVAESMRRGDWYREQNVGGTGNLLAAMRAAGVDRLIFSSTAAVYGDVGVAPVVEDDPASPINPYGQTKLDGERLISAATEWGLRAVSLRYFNAVGAAAPELGDLGATNLVPIVLDQIDRGEPPVIFGADWPTPDGTCVRDYVHVCDIAEVHDASLRLLHGGAGNTVLNVGTGHGTSVREMIERAFGVTGRRIEPVIAARRPGDSASVTASVGRVAQLLGWRATRSVDEMVASAWAARPTRAAI